MNNTCSNHWLCTADTRTSLSGMNYEEYKEVYDKMTTNYNEMFKSNVRVKINGINYFPREILRYTRSEGEEYRLYVKTTPQFITDDGGLSIKNVIFNPPATIVYWEDGSKTVVKCQEGDEFDPEKGIAMAFFKRMHGNKGHYFEQIKEWSYKYSMSLFKDEVHEMKDEKILDAVEKGMSAKDILVSVIGSVDTEELKKAAEVINKHFSGVDNECQSN